MTTTQELSVERKADTVTIMLDQFEKKIQDLERFIFFSKSESKDFYLEKVRSIYLILNELDYTLLRIYTYKPELRMDILDGIIMQIRQYQKKLKELSEVFEDEKVSAQAS